MGNDEDPTGKYCIRSTSCTKPGSNMISLERSPRGIPGFALTGGNFTTWKVQGKLGGYTKYVETVNFV